MKLVQKSLMHTGYFILKDGSIIPGFSNDLVNESMMIPYSKDVRRMQSCADLEIQP